MSDVQLYLAIGIPVAFSLLGFTIMMWSINHRFDAQEKFFTEKLGRVEQVLDARLRRF